MPSQPKKPSSSWIPRLGAQARSLLSKLHRAVVDTSGPVVRTEGLTGSNPDRYFDPAILARVGFSPLLARVVVEGFINGLHKSPFHGFSVEFTEYRQYTPGDDTRFVDWRLVGRTDRYYIKKFEDETNLRCFFLVDQSKSMSYGSAG